MNDSNRSNFIPKPREAKSAGVKPQWMTEDDQPVVGRIVSIGNGQATGPQRTPAQVANAPAQSPDTPFNSTSTVESRVENRVKRDIDNQATNEQATAEPLGKIGRSRLAILTTVFVVAGVLGVPLIVYSPAFSKIEKIFWSIVATMYSGVLLYILYRVIVWFLAQI